MLDVNGQLKLQSWSEIDQKWHPLKSSRCGDYNCGAFSICNETAHIHDLACVCLTGFKPISADAWRKGNASSGCVRKTALRCTNNTNVQKDGFLTMFKVYWPDNPLHLDMGDEKKCESACLNNCSCIAYAYEYEHFKNGHNFSMFRCFIWNGFLLNLKQHSVYARYAKDFYLKLAPSDLVTQDTSSRNGTSPAVMSAATNQVMSVEAKRLIAILAICMPLATLILGLFVYCLRSKLRKKGEKRCS
ncbi:G-type lectin S-receptor-like serine/threonine-protein kinase At4g03230 isoform X4 [Fagus crenata]